MNLKIICILFLVFSVSFAYSGDLSESLINKALKSDKNLLPVIRQSTWKPAHLKATDCLIQDIDAPRLVVELEYCTVNTDWKCAELRASDSILLGTLEDIGTLKLRYSCAPQLPESYNGNIHNPYHPSSLFSTTPKLHLSPTAL